MKRKIFIFTLFSVLVSLSSCQEDAIELFGDQNYIYFTQESKKPYRFSFATVPGTEVYEFKIPMSLIGKMLPSDRTYRVEVVTSGSELVTTASSASFSLPENPVFRSGLIEDTLKVTLRDNPELAQEKVLVLRVADNDNFLVGPVKNQMAVLYLSNYLVQPDWWDEDMENVFLGPYSDIKYREFIIATGKSDLTGLSASQVQAYVITFIYHLRELDENGNTLYEADGVTKVLDTISYTNI